MGIRDFLRMHYDTPRKDNEFWQEASHMPMPQSYQINRECWQNRTPRLIDINSYVQHDWSGISHTINSLYVGVPLGIIPLTATQVDLLAHL